MKTSNVFILSVLILLLASCERDKNILGPQNGGEGKIVYNSGGDIYMMNVYGCNKINITADMTRELDTSFNIEDISKDGKRILFTQTVPKTTGTGAIYTTWMMDSNGENKKSLGNADWNPLRPRFSEDGSMIVFQATDDIDDVCIMNSDSLNPRNITSDRNRDSSPHFYPDGQKLIYVSGEGDQMDLYSINLNGSNRMNLTNDGTLWGADYRFSYNGAKIIYSSSKGGQNNVYTMNSDGSNLTQITNAGGGMKPVMSFDNSMIAFVAVTLDGYDIRVIDSDGKNEKTIASTVRPQHNDYWQPVVLFTTDNNNIIFTSYNDGNDEIYKADLKGNNLQNLTSSPENDGLAIVLP